MTALVWFNGHSTRQFLELPRYPIEIGCNYFADIRLVDHICCLDERMKSKIIKKHGITYWCKNGYRSPGWNEVNYVMTEQPDNSGMLAIKLAINLGCKKIRIIGCDWGLEQASLFEQSYNNSKPGKKYNNDCKKILREWAKHRDIKFVHRGLPDVPLAVVANVD